MRRLFSALSNEFSVSSPSLPIKRHRRRLSARKLLISRCFLVSRECLSQFACTTHFSGKGGGAAGRLVVMGPRFSNRNKACASTPPSSGSTSGTRRQSRAELAGAGSLSGPIQGRPSAQRSPACRRSVTLEKLSILARHSRCRKQSSETLHSLLRKTLPYR